MRQRMILRRWGPLALLLLLLIAGAVLGIWHYQKTYISINDTLYHRTAADLDLRGVQQPDLDEILQLSQLESLDIRDTGISAQDYERLRAALPDCDIRWSVPFQNSFVDSDITSLTIEGLSLDDISSLAYLPKLKSVDADGCRDYPALWELQQQYPDLNVEYRVFAGEETYPRDAEKLELQGVDAAHLAQLLPHFSGLKEVRLDGPQDDEAMFGLMKDYPQISFSWDLEICGVTVNSLAEEIDISNIAVEDLEDLEAAVVRLPNLKKVVMCNCGIPDEEMEALNNRHDDILFVWSVTIRGVTLRTDITSLIPAKYNLWPSAKEAQKYRYFTELICLDLGHHTLYNCDFVAYMPKLQYLLLGDTRISDLTPLEGLTEIVYLEIFLTDVRDYTPLLKLTKLQDLNLCYTKGQPEVIAQMTWLKYVRWVTAEWGQVYKDEKEMLQAALPDTLLEFGIGLSSTGGQWRKTKNYFAQRDILGMYYMTG